MILIDKDALLKELKQYNTWDLVAVNQTVYEVLLDKEGNKEE